jgi:glycerol kinase
MLNRNSGCSVSDQARYVLAIDQGTSATKALILDSRGAIVGRGEVPLTELHSTNGVVEQNPYLVEDSIRQAVKRATENFPLSEVCAIGISNQRESVVLWNKNTQTAVSSIVSWQDSRAAQICEKLRSAGLDERIQELSGLPLDPMFSAAKISWLLDYYDADRSKSRSGELAVGTIDSWLTRSTSNHSIEIGNASRTQLLDIHTGEWSQELLEAFNIPLELMPQVRSSTFKSSLHGEDDLAKIPVLSILGDSHSALFGHGIHVPGIAKVTYGTGSSIMTLTEGIPLKQGGIARTIAWKNSQEISYALEGNIRSAGSTLKWVSQITGKSVEELSSLAASAADDLLQIIPAFNGLAAPWWDANVRGVITGLAFNSGPAEFARAAINAVALQVRDVIMAMNDCGAGIEIIEADGGASLNNYLMQLQSDLLKLPVHRSQSSDFSALGTAYLAGIEGGLWNTSDLENGTTKVFSPQNQDTTLLLHAWENSLSLARRYPTR